MKAKKKAVIGSIKKPGSKTFFAGIKKGGKGKPPKGVMPWATGKMKKKGGKK